VGNALGKQNKMKEVMKMFKENEKEFSVKQGKDIPVWKSPKYEEAKKKAIELIESKKYGLEESDFWILMNETKTGSMMYSGLILSHNGCLKINDKQEENMKFKPSCMTLDKEGYGNSLVYTYINDEQGVYEVGEVSKDNCKNAYPYAMALKRCMDRVILKNCKLAYAGVYSDSEADEFAEPQEKQTKIENRITKEQATTLLNLLKTKFTDEQITKTLNDRYEVKSTEELNEKQYVDILNKIKNAN
jgi:hypothetical protein